MMQFEPFFVALDRVILKSRPLQDALAAELASELGLQVTFPLPLTEEERERFLFGRFFSGVGKPLKFDSQTQLESPLAFVNRNKILNGTFIVDTFSESATPFEIKPLRPVSLHSEFGIVRFGFTRLHTRSLIQRWLNNQHTRLAAFPGSPVYYLLGL